MKWTFWQTEGRQDRWAVCDGPGPLKVAGYITFREGTWFAEGKNTQFLDMESAAAAITEEPLPKDGNFYIIARNGETRVVFTYPDILPIHLADGWRKVSILKTTH
jgi:hypothetical protein